MQDIQTQNRPRHLQSSTGSPTQYTTTPKLRHPQPTGTLVTIDTRYAH
ncbi:hypothetical protein CaCOL14_007675 [Colletotrichum acutatum]